jgi:hypothetical protein
VIKRGGVKFVVWYSCLPVTAPVMLLLAWLIADEWLDAAFFFPSWGDFT